MNKTEIKLVYSLLRDLEDFYGSNRTCIISLESFIGSLKELDCTRKDIKAKIFELAHTMKNSEPKIIHLIHLIEDFENEIKSKNIFAKGEVDEIKSITIELLQKKIDLFKSNLAKVVNHGVKEVKDSDVIAVHSVSSVVVDILLQAKKNGKKFRVVILKQDFVKTKQLINKLDSAGIKHTIVPEYNMSHSIEQITKLFLGAMAVTANQEVVAATGTTSIVSLCHLHDIPIYLFMSSLKFSHKHRREQNIHRKEESKYHNNCRYCLVSHSHDTFNINLVHHLVTEKGRTILENRNNPKSHRIKQLVTI